MVSAPAECARSCLESGAGRALLQGQRFRARGRGCGGSSGGERTNHHARDDAALLAARSAGSREGNSAAASCDGGSIGAGTLSRERRRKPARAAHWRRSHRARRRGISGGAVDVAGSSGGAIRCGARRVDSRRADANGFIPVSINWHAGYPRDRSGGRECAECDDPPRHDQGAARHSNGCRARHNLTSTRNVDSRRIASGGVTGSPRRLDIRDSAGSRRAHAPAARRRDHGTCEPRAAVAHEQTGAARVRRAQGSRREVRRPLRRLSKCGGDSSRRAASRKARAARAHAVSRCDDRLAPGRSAAGLHAAQADGSIATSPG